MYEELMCQLGACMDKNIPCEEANCGYKPFSKDEDCVDNLMHRAVNAIEELSRVAEAIPHVCECCIGCEVETGGCDRAFVLSPKRAREYLSKPRWIPVTERLPEEWESVFVCFKSQGGLAQAVSERMGNDWTGLCGLKALWWMPLPDPPREG